MFDIRLSYWYSICCAFGVLKSGVKQHENTILRA